MPTLWSTSNPHHMIETRSQIFIWKCSTSNPITWMKLNLEFLSEYWNLPLQLKRHFKYFKKLDRVLKFVLHPWDSETKNPHILSYIIPRWGKLSGQMTWVPQFIFVSNGCIYLVNGYKVTFWYINQNHTLEPHSIVSL